MVCRTVVEVVHQNAAVALTPEGCLVEVGHLVQPSPVTAATNEHCEKAHKQRIHRLRLKHGRNSHFTFITS